jgi:hypothetical protein
MKSKSILYKAIEKWMKYHTHKQWVKLQKLSALTATH